MLSTLAAPCTDPTPIFEAFRGSYGSELLTAAVAHFRLFDRLASRPCTEAQLAADLALSPRAATVLFTALRALGLLRNTGGRLELTDLAREHLVADSYFDVSGYLGLVADAPGVIAMVERLRTSRPAGTESAAAGAAFIYREGLESAMEKAESARKLTLALAGRAKNVAPLLAKGVDLSQARMLVDVGGGTGIYSIACLQRNRQLRAFVWDRPEVLKVAEEMAAAYGVADRLECLPGDMFADAVPPGDAILLSNVLHDWDTPQCGALVQKCAAALPPGGKLLIHDVFLSDELDGPLPIALYSAALFALTEGRAYSAAEYRQWLHSAGLATGEIAPTLIHCGVLTGTKP